MRLSVHVAIVVGLAGVLPLPFAALGQTNTSSLQSPGAAQATLSPSQQMPAPPRVSFADGKLTVIANNSTIQDVVNAVRGATGTTFDVLGGPIQDRLFGQYGPGPVNTVLEQILRGSGFNYIFVSTPGAPGQVKTATLMAKSNEASTPAIAPQRSPAQQNANQEAPPDANSGGEDETPQPEPAQEEPTPQLYPQISPPAENSPANPNAPKSPEQLLQELQRLQQLRQQQQQNNTANPQ
ncbi:MAG: hypothetical protein ABI383_03320 [Acidobacteriaceae bacterium]